MISKPHIYFKSSSTHHSVEEDKSHLETTTLTEGHKCLALGIYGHSPWMFPVPISQKRPCQLENALRRTPFPGENALRRNEISLAERPSYASEPRVIAF